MTTPGTRKHDATGRSAGAKSDRFAFNRPPADEPWIWLSRSMLESPAWTAMPLAARKVVERIELEHRRCRVQPRGKRADTSAIRSADICPASSR